MKPRAPIKPHQTALLIAGAATLACLLVPVLQRMLLPLAYLNTHLHELSHALMSQITGGEVERIIVNSNGSGVSPVMGGNITLTAAAGYTGASIFGAMMIYFGRTEKGARATLLTVAAMLAFSLVVWVRGDAIGVASGIGWAIALPIVALCFKQTPLVFCCQFLGLQQCLNSVKSVFDLVQITVGTEVHSDASILQDATHLPALAWSLGFAAFSLGLVYWSLRKSWVTLPRSGSVR
jgi:hypothetical protein